MQGWIKLHRELLDKAIWKCSTPEQKTILITLLMMASHKESEWNWKGEKFKIKPGQFITSLNSITERAGSGITIRKVRTAIDKFEKYGFLTSQSTNKNRLITIVNWELYQSQDETLTSNLTSNRQAVDNYQEYKEYKEEIKEILEYLNQKTNKTFRATNKKAVSYIQFRLKEGYSLNDFFKVIDTKAAQWGEEPKMIPFLRPETLFGDKFEGYLNELPEDEAIFNWRGSDKRL